jgi:hypothetical protein
MARYLRGPLLSLEASPEAQMVPRRRPRASVRNLFGVAAFVLVSCGGASPPTSPSAPDVGVGVRVAEAAPAATGTKPAAPIIVPVGEDPPATTPGPDASGMRVAMDLVANRINAVTHREGHLVIDAGSPDFLKYVDGNWKTSWILGQSDEGKPAALINNISSILFVPVDGDGDGAGGTATGAAIGDTLLSFTGRALAPKQRLSIFVNEKAVSTLEIDPATKRYDVNVPAGVFKAGENRIRFTFRSAAAVAGGKRSAAAIKSITIGRSPRRRRRWAARAAAR